MKTCDLFKPKLLLSALVASALVLPGVVRAAPSAGTAHRGTPALQTDFRVHLVGRAHPHRVTSASQLVFDWPSSVQLLSADRGRQVLDLGQLNASSDFNSSPFGQLHKVPYVQAGTQGAWQAQAVITDSPKDVNGNYTDQNAYYNAFWLGTYYQTTQQASARVQDAVDAAQIGGFTMNDCTSGSFMCKYIVYSTLPDGTVPVYQGERVVVFYAIVSYGNAVGEILLLPRQGSLTNDEINTFNNDYTAIITAGFNLIGRVGADSSTPPTTVPTSVPTVAQPTNTPLVSVPTATNTPRPVPTERPTSAPRPTNTPAVPAIHIKDFVLTQAKGSQLFSTTTPKSGVKSLFVLNATMENPGNLNPQANLVITKNGKQVSSSPMHRQAVQGDTVQFTASKTFSAKKKAITESATVNLTLGPASDSNSFDFTIKTNCKKVHGKKKCK